MQQTFTVQYILLCTSYSPPFCCMVLLSVVLEYNDKYLLRDTSLNGTYCTVPRELCPRTNHLNSSSGCGCCVLLSQGEGSTHLSSSYLQDGCSVLLSAQFPAAYCPSQCLENFGLRSSLDWCEINARVLIQASAFIETLWVFHVHRRAATYSKEGTRTHGHRIREDYKRSRDSKSGLG